MYSDLSSHKKIYKCNECEKSFAYKTVLEIHIGRKHLVTRDVPCLQCDKKFFDKHDLKNHITVVHNEERPFKCDECEYAFKRSSGYYEHKRRHKDTKDYECPVCHKTFKNKKSLVRCMEGHNLEGKHSLVMLPHVTQCSKHLSFRDVILKECTLKKLLQYLSLVLCVQKRLKPKVI